MARITFFGVFLAVLSRFSAFFPKRKGLLQNHQVRNSPSAN
jgi:hypothetical protein